MDRKVTPRRRPTTNIIAKYHWHTPLMQESVSTHKNPIPVRHSHKNQVRSEEEDKETEANGKKGSQQKKNVSEELKRGIVSMGGIRLAPFKWEN